MINSVNEQGVRSQLNVRGIVGPCLVPKILQNFSDSPSHRIFKRMHEVLNIDENKN